MSTQFQVLSASLSLDVSKFQAPLARLTQSLTAFDKLLGAVGANQKGKGLAAVAEQLAGIGRNAQRVLWASVPSAVARTTTAVGQLNAALTTTQGKLERVAQSAAVGDLGHRLAATTQRVGGAVLNRLGLGSKEMRRPDAAAEEEIGKQRQRGAIEERRSDAAQFAQANRAVARAQGAPPDATREAYDARQGMLKRLAHASAPERAAGQQDITLVMRRFARAVALGEQAMRAQGDVRKKLLGEQQQELTAARSMKAAFDGGTRGAKQLAAAAQKAGVDLDQLDAAEQAKVAQSEGMLSPVQQAVQQAAQQVQQRLQQQMQQAIQAAPQMAAAAAAAPWAAQGQGMADLQQAIRQASTAGDLVSAFKLLGTLVGAKLGAAKANLHLLSQQGSFGTGAFGPQGDNYNYLMTTNTPGVRTVRRLQAALDAISRKIAALIAGKKHFAAGGIVTSPTDAYLGESGPEAVIPLDRLAGGVGSDAFGMLGQTRAIQAFAGNVLNALLYRSRLGGLPNISKMLSGDESYFLQMMAAEGLNNGWGAYGLDQLAALRESLAGGIERYRNSRQIYLGPGAPALLSGGSPWGGYGGGPHGVAPLPPGMAYAGGIHNEIHVHGADLTSEAQRREVAESLVGHIDAAVKRRGFDRSGASALRTPYHVGARPPGVTSGMPQ